MSKKTEPGFISLLEDETFIERAATTENPEELVKELAAKNPDQADTVRYAVEFIQVNRLQKIKLDTADFDLIMNNIRSYSGRKKSNNRRKIFGYMWRAAVVFIALAAGSYFAYDQLKKDPLAEFAHSIVSDGSKKMIILSDGSERLLKNNQSYIEYDASGAEVIIKSEEKENRIENRDDLKKPILNQVVVPYGQRQSVLLSDGTSVQLNAGSKLVFPAKFTGKTREVYLQGEGFFDVYKNEKSPFIVKTDYINVEVLGTMFNISAYGDENTVTTVLVEGKVNVSQKEKMFVNKNFELAPGQGCFYSREEQNSVVTDVDVNQYIAWKDGFFYFKNMRLLDLVRQVKKYYNVPVRIKGEKLANTMVSGKLVLSEDFGEVAEYLAKTIEGRCGKTEDGNYILEL